MEERVCSVCWEEGDLVSACACRGSIGWAHVACLEQAFVTRGDWLVFSWFSRFLVGFGRCASDSERERRVLSEPRRP